MEPPPPGGPGAWSSQPSPSPGDPSVWTAGREARECGPMGQKQGAPSFTSVASRQSSIVGPEYGLQSPPTPNALWPFAEGSQGRTGAEEARTPSQLPAPRPQPWDRTPAATHCPRSHKAALVPRPRGRRAAPPRGLCPPPQSTPTREGLRRKPLPPPTPQSPTRGGEGGSLQGGRTIFLAVALPARPQSPLQGQILSALVCPGWWGCPAGRGRPQR